MAVIDTEGFSKVAVIIPCRNEELTVAQVINDTREAIPGCQIWVYDNNSTDETAKNASEAGAFLKFESDIGKGNVIRRALAEIKAESYVIIDGDGTYDPSEAPILLKTLLEEDLDMVVGCRSGAINRSGHRLGNAVFNRLYRWLFGEGFNDIFSGFRVLSRRFVVSFPSSSKGFEIETEISVHASQLRLPVSEVEVSYRDRPVGSESKLRTGTDGWQILRTMFKLLKENRPLFLYNTLALGTFVLAASLGIPVIVDFSQTGVVERLPTAVLSSALIVLSLIQSAIGLILDTVARSRIEMKRLVYLGAN